MDVAWAEWHRSLAPPAGPLPRGAVVAVQNLMHE